MRPGSQMTIALFGFGLFLAGCSRQPADVPQQVVEAKGPKGLVTLRVTGPQSVPPKASLDHPVEAPIKVEVQGPANGAVHLLVNISEGAGQGCFMVESFSYSLPLDSSGNAAETKMLSYGNPRGCLLDILATVGTQRKREATGIVGAVGDNIPGGDIEETRVSLRITSELH